MKNRKQLLGTCAIAVATGLAGLGIGTAVSFADDAKAGGHPHDTLMKQHVEMFEGADGAAKAKQMMTMMAAHQYLLGDMTNSDEVKQLAQTPEMKKAISEVKAAMKDHATRDAKKDEVSKKGDEAMMVIAHALLKQDAEAAQMLKAAEEGKHGEEAKH